MPSIYPLSCRFSLCNNLQQVLLLKQFNGFYSFNLKLLTSPEGDGADHVYNWDWFFISSKISLYKYLALVFWKKALRSNTCESRGGL